MRSGSSEKDASGAPGVASTEAWRSRTPPNGIHELQGGQPQGHGVDGEVPAQQVVRQGVAERHHGLAGIGIVRLGAVRGDFDLEAGLAHPDGAEGAPDLPVVVRPLLDEGDRLVRGGVGGEVQVRGRPAQEQVAHGPAHQGQFVAGVDKALPELQDHRVHLEINSVRVSLVMCVRHSSLSLSEIPASTAPKAAQDPARNRTPAAERRSTFPAVHFRAMFRSSSAGKSR